MSDLLVELRSLLARAADELGRPISQWSAPWFREDGYDRDMARYMAAALNALPALLSRLEAAEVLLVEAQQSVLMDLRAVERDFGCDSVHAMWLSGLLARIQAHIAQQKGGSNG